MEVEERNEREALGTDPAKDAVNQVGLKGEVFINQENEPADDATKAYIAAWARQLGLSEGARPTSLRSIHNCLSDVIASVLKTKTGHVCWRGKNEASTGAVYGSRIVRKVRNALLNHGFLKTVQAPVFGTNDGKAAVYQADRGSVPTTLKFKKHGIGTFIEVRGRKPTNFAMKKAKRKAAVRSLSHFSKTDVDRMTSDMGRLVKLWTEHPLTGPDGEQWASAKRTFNNDKLVEGGRVYGDWQNLKARERLDFTIDGKAVCEIDVRGSYLFLAYKLSGGTELNLGEDPYQDIPFVRENPAWRKLAKVLTSAMLSHRCDRRSFPKGRANKDGKVVSFRETYSIPKKVPASYFYDQIRDAFPFMNGMRDVGVKLMFLESEIIMDAMLSLASRKKPVAAYPVHDCLICKREDEGLVVKALHDSYLKHTGGVPYLEVEFSDRPPFTIVPYHQPICPTNFKVPYQLDWGINETSDFFDVIDEEDDFSPVEEPIT